jgi:O-acetyl-ADP-ribose deacetylase (regulator of RNase III)
MLNLTLKIGNITEENVDAIVNAANQRMLGGGGVDGAIHRAAGHGLVSECLQVPIVENAGTDYEVRCPVGEAKITGGHNLPARYVIHTVGPKGTVKGATSFVDDIRRKQLYDCWYNSLRLANSYNLETIAFPSIATGGYLFPINEAAPIAIKAIKDFDKDFPGTSLKDVIIVTFSKEDYKFYENSITAGGELPVQKAIFFNPYNLFK